MSSGLELMLGTIRSKLVKVLNLRSWSKEWRPLIFQGTYFLLPWWLVDAYLLDAEMIGYIVSPSPHSFKWFYWRWYNLPMPGFAMLPEIMSSVPWQGPFLLARCTAAQHRRVWQKLLMHMDLQWLLSMSAQEAFGSLLSRLVLTDQVSGYLSTSHCHYSICIHPMWNLRHCPARLVSHAAVPFSECWWLKGS